MEQYFYCKYGGIGPICSDCKRNPVNSPYKPSTIGTWLLPNHIKTNGTGCTDYIPIKEPIMVNKQEFIENVCRWLKDNANDYIEWHDQDGWLLCKVNADKLSDDFRKIMEASIEK